MIKLKNDDTPRLSDTSVNKYLVKINTFMNWAQRNMLIDFVPGEGYENQIQQEGS
jgi:hypothetical protein